MWTNSFSADSHDHLIEYEKLTSRPVPLSAVFLPLFPVRNFCFTLGVLSQMPVCFDCSCQWPHKFNVSLFFNVCKSVVGQTDKVTILNAFLKAYFRSYFYQPRECCMNFRSCARRDIPCYCYCKFIIMIMIYVPRILNPSDMGTWPLSDSGVFFVVRHWMF